MEAAIFPSSTSAAPCSLPIMVTFRLTGVGEAINPTRPSSSGRGLSRRKHHLSLLFSALEQLCCVLCPLFRCCLRMTWSGWIMLCHFPPWTSIFTSGFMLDQAGYPQFLIMTFQWWSFQIFDSHHWQENVFILVGDKKFKTIFTTIHKFATVEVYLKELTARLSLHCQMQCWNFLW